MSWNFGMKIDVGGTEPRDLGYEANYTYNVSPMFYRAIGGEGIRSIDGQTGETVVPILDAAIREMTENPEMYKAMNPENGWGDYYSAIDLLKELRSWGVESPNARYTVH